MWYTVLFLCLTTLGLQGDSSTGQWNGAGYDKHSSPQYFTARTLLADVNLNNCHHILDLGCGSGAVTSFIAEQTPASVVGMDKSPEMISFAQDTYKAPNLSFFVQDISTWQGSPNAYDLILSFNCLHWVSNLSDVMQAISKSLKPDGLFIAATAHHGHFLYKSLLTVAKDPTWKSFIENPEQEPWFGHDEKSMRTILTHAGLDASLRTWNKTLSFESVDAFIDFLSNWMGAVPQVQSLPLPLRKCFINAVAYDFLRTIHLKPDGSFEFTTPILIVHAKKKI